MLEAGRPASRSPAMAAPHKAVARWLSQHEAAAFRVMAAEHFEQADDFVLAAEPYELAVDLAAERGAAAEAEAVRLRAQAAVEGAGRTRK
jgi:hypothetical protein